MKKQPEKKQIGPLDYWRKHGVEVCTELAQRAGTKYTYWKMICNRVKRPGLDLARRLVAESGGELSIELLCPPTSTLRKTASPPLPGGNTVGRPRKSPVDETSGPESKRTKSQQRSAAA